LLVAAPFAPSCVEASQTTDDSPRNLRKQVGAWLFRLRIQGGISGRGNLVRGGGFRWHGRNRPYRADISTHAALNAQRLIDLGNRIGQRNGRDAALALALAAADARLLIDDKHDRSRSCIVP
jgi:hypothetical protein